MVKAISSSPVVQVENLFEHIATWVLETFMDLFSGAISLFLGEDSKKSAEKMQKRTVTDLTTERAPSNTAPSITKLHEADYSLPWHRRVDFPGSDIVAEVEINPDDESDAYAERITRNLKEPYPVRFGNGLVSSLTGRLISKPQKKAPAASPPSPKGDRRT